MQNIDFIGYHVRRTTVTVFLHLSLPLVYCLGLSVVDPDLSLVSGSSPHTLTPSHPSHKHTHTAVLPAIPPVPLSPLGPLPFLRPARSGHGTPLVTRRVEKTSPRVTAHPATATMEVLVIHELSTFKLCNLGLSVVEPC